jgi:hypothetical protein
MKCFGTSTSKPFPSLPPLLPKCCNMGTLLSSPTTAFSNGLSRGNSRIQHPQRSVTTVSSNRGQVLN